MNEPTPRPGSEPEVLPHQPAGTRDAPSYGLDAVQNILALDSSLSAMATADLEGRLTYVNRAFVEMWGYASPGEVLTRPVLEFWADNPPMEAVIKAVLERGTWAGERDGQRRDGTVFPAQIFVVPVLDGDGRPLGMLGSFLDVSGRAQMEAELRSKEERLRLALSGANVGLYDLDLRTRAAYVTPEYATMLGYDPADFKMTVDRWSDLLHPDDRDRVTALFHECLRGESPAYSVEYRARTRSGEWKWLLSVGKTIVSAETGRPERLLGIHSDISERKRSEQVLRESWRHYEELVSSVPLGVYRVEPEADLSFRFVYVSDRYCSTIGLPRETILADARSTVEIIHPDDRASFEELNRAAIVHRQPFAWEGRIAVDGETRWLRAESHPSEPDGGTSAWTGVAVDITERKRAETALRDGDYFLTRSQEVARIGSYDLDVASGRWTCTRALEEMFGIDDRYPKNVEGWLNLIAPDDREGMRDYFLQHVLAERNRFEREYRVVRPRDGQERWVFGMGELEVDADGSPVRMIGTIQDITDRKRAEDERLGLERRLLHAQKLESLGVLAGGIAHDFNNLLMAMLGNLDLALTQLSPTSSARDGIEQAVIAARRAADLTRQMLAYSGKASFDVRVVDLNELVEENVHLFRACISKIVTLSLQLERDHRAVRADAGQIQQVIMNLITNASEAIGDRAGVVTLKTGDMECDAAYLRRSRLEDIPEPGSFVFVEVSDTGCGMDEHTQQRLFDPFFTTKFMGRGLGMSAILGIVRGHKGAILVDSTPGQGSAIRVLFPAGDVSPSTRDAKTPPAQGSQVDRTQTRRRVLVVDDEDMVRSVCRRMLQQDGWDVLEASGGPAALGQFEAHADDIACVVLDLSMPQMDGIAVCRALRAIRPNVKVILSSGYSRSQELSQDVTNEGFAGFIQKPYTAQALRAEVTRVVTGHSPDQAGGMRS